MSEEIQALRANLFDHIIEARRDKAVELLTGEGAAKGFGHAVHAILEPVLAEIGERWARDRLSLAQGYVAGKVAEDILRKMAESTPFPAGERKGPVVIGNIEDDHHALGRKMVAIFLASAGWEVVDLGNDVLPTRFVDTAEESGARIIGVSAMMLTTAENILLVRRELDRRGLGGRVQLAVGGAVINLRPELVPRVGGDGTCANAIQAPALFDRLWARALETERGAS
ncbi:cobalamin B12-binding domain protein [Solidesulfovibrio carbinoliphilus subsp. oakridgensis]|uniref:Cobalamin B12-binding domain protein n=1 Tax=Solidesulfovibrio carbinoliphilus subsp. oakridgensis TaxID=694327 RepID=G7Q4U6_9BACT|nr:cobalamin-dependent protein [Solidesulfovibrio carbinoliphilus]EHJ47556.1 cobalamin B12-binding domain protein [Solidesulfovibrio carbinoliphilus subsp. oakridgensis]